MHVVMLHADIRNAHSVSTIVECVHLKSPAGIVHKHIKDITDWCNSVTLPKLRRLVQSHQSPVLTTCKFSSFLHVFSFFLHPFKVLKL